MLPTQILSNEHRVIEVVLDCLEAACAQARQKESVDYQVAGEILDFIKNFADGCHHGKEEKHLFPAMEKKGIPREDGPIGVMLNEHDQGRAYVKGMRENLKAASQGDKEALDGFIVHAQGYTGLLRNHIGKEDGILFPMAGRVMSEPEFDDLTKKFQHVESHEMGEGTHEKYLELARSLADRFGIDHSAVAELTKKGACGCSHAK